MKNKMIIKIIVMSAVFLFFMIGCSLNEEDAYLRIINQNDAPIMLVAIGDNRWDNLNIIDMKDFTISLAEHGEYWINVVFGNSNFRQIFVPIYKRRTEVVILTDNGILVLYPSSINGGPIKQNKKATVD